jgi:hypothetical protein
MDQQVITKLKSTDMVNRPDTSSEVGLIQEMDRMAAGRDLQILMTTQVEATW